MDRSASIVTGARIFLRPAPRNADTRPAALDPNGAKGELDTIRDRAAGGPDSIPIDRHKGVPEGTFPKQERIAAGGARKGAEDDMQLVPVSIVFDFDGVIVDSVAIKSQAFQDVYADATPEQLAAIDRYHHAHGGVSRREKFRYFEAALFGRQTDPAGIEALAERYRTIVYEKVVACRLIPGALDFLNDIAQRLPLHLVSGTPQEELEAIVERRGLRHFFQRVIGAPTLKPAAFATLAAEYGHDPRRMVAIGDSTTEFDAARGMGMPFVGIVAEGIANPFPPAIPVLPDMTGLARALGLSAMAAATG